MLYHPIQVRGSWIMTMHKPLSDEFLSSISATGEVHDRRPNSDEQLAHSTAVLFLKDGHRVALLKGNPSAPGSEDLHNFLKNWTTPPKDHLWAVNPLMRSDQLQRVRESSGVIGLNIGVEATDDLLTGIDRESAPKLSGIANRVHEEIAPHSRVTIGVKLDTKLYVEEEAQALKREAEAEFSRGTTRPKTGQAIILGPDGATEIVNLIREQVALNVEIEGPDPERALFTDLAGSLLRAKSQIEVIVGE